jgi:hypothetical protein
MRTPTARVVVESIAFGMLRLAATGCAVAGIAMVAAASTVQALGGDAEWVTVVRAGAIGLAGTLLVAGGITLYLGRVTAASRDGSQMSAGTGFDGWIGLFPVTLVGATALMILGLRPLASFWRDVFALADRLNFWPGLFENSQYSGYVLMPIIAVLTPPGVDAIAAAGVVAGSALMFALLLVRSARVPTALLAWTVLQGALTLVIAAGTELVDRLAPSIEQLVRSTPDPNGVEQAQVMAELQRYGAVVRGASRTLAWTWGLIAVWVPVLLAGARGRATFAAVADPSLPQAATREAPAYSTLDGDDRRRAYEEAARRIDRSTRASRF